MSKRWLHGRSRAKPAEGCEVFSRFIEATTADRKRRMSSNPSQGRERNRQLSPRNSVRLKRKRSRVFVGDDLDESVVAELSLGIERGREEDIKETMHHYALTATEVPDGMVQTCRRLEPMAGIKYR